MFNFCIRLFVVAVLFTGQAVHAQEYQVVPNHTADSSIPPTVQIQPDAELQAQCATCSFTTYRLVRQLNCGAVVAIEDVLSGKPTCRMVPRVSVGGAIELEWDTTNADVVFIDNGTGHVALGHGARTVAPTQDTTYNMTVVSEDGLVGVCSAVIDISSANEQEDTAVFITGGGTGQGGVSQQYADRGLYEYNESTVRKDSTALQESVDDGEYRSRVIAHTATMSANGSLVKAVSFFSSGIFLIIALLLLFILALWLIFKHGVR